MKKAARSGTGYLRNNNGWGQDIIKDIYIFLFCSEFGLDRLTG
jgi:hypothetical protein